MDSILFFDLVLIISDLALALVITGLYLFWITKGHISVNTGGRGTPGNARLLEEARLKAIKIIDEANNQAMDIVSKATLTAATASDNFKDNLSHTSSAQIKEFEKATSDFTALYFQVLQDLKTKNIEVFQSLSKDIEKDTVDEIKSFKESMQKLTTLSQNEIKKKIDADYEILKTEVENHKKEKMQKVDSEIYRLLEEISKLVLGKALSLSEHEGLIEESVEKAKKEGIFG
jgi:hypothetical protein